MDNELDAPDNPFVDTGIFGTDLNFSSPLPKKATDDPKTTATGKKQIDDMDEKETEKKVVNPELVSFYFT